LRHSLGARTDKEERRRIEKIENKKRRRKKMYWILFYLFGIALAKKDPEIHISMGVAIKSLKELLYMRAQSRSSTKLRAHQKFINFK